jgi:hypothetical protein
MVAGPQVTDIALRLTGGLQTWSNRFIDWSGDPALKSPPC